MSLGGVVGLAVFHGQSLATLLTFLPGEEIDARFVAAILEHLRESVLGRASLLSPSFYSICHAPSATRTPSISPAAAQWRNA